MQLKRVAGGLEETLLLATGQAIRTVRDEPFTVPDEEGEDLLGDGTERFEEVI
jgi:hypothetical protein